ncbi:MAG TPA: hypothetical protein VFP42_02295, partial [Acidimicrobiia bacterium]|nr:hypothetical protein [Acidimicrobiia bacterium]
GSWDRHGGDDDIHLYVALYLLGAAAVAYGIPWKQSFFGSLCASPRIGVGRDHRRFHARTLYRWCTCFRWGGRPELVP